KQLEQSRLAAAVGPDQADAITAEHGRRKLANHRSALPGKRNAFGLDDLAPGLARAGGLHLDASLALAALQPLAAHLFQRAHATLVARAARLDALTYPDLFLGQLLVEALVFQRFGMSALVRPSQVIPPVARPRGDLTAVDFHDASSQRLQEAAIMG